MTWHVECAASNGHLLLHLPSQRSLGPMDGATPPIGCSMNASPSTEQGPQVGHKCSSSRAKHASFDALPPANKAQVLFFTRPTIGRLGARIVLLLQEYDAVCSVRLSQDQGWTKGRQTPCSCPLSDLLKPSSISKQREHTEQIYAGDPCFSSTAH